MDEVRASPPPRITKTAKREPRTAAKEECLAFIVSLQGSFRYAKAKAVGLAKKVTARNEKEATAAELEASKMEVEAADEAENIKKRIHKSL